MSEKEKEDKDKLNFKIISSDTSVKVPSDKDEENEAVQDLIRILKPKIEAPKPKVQAPKPISSKPLPLGTKVAKPIQFSPIQKPQSKVTTGKTSEIPSKSTITKEVESEIMVSDELGGEDISEDLLKMSQILQGIKEDEISERLEEQKPLDIPEDHVILGIQVECPHCGRKILLDRLEFLKQGYSDYCPHCNLMLLPDILPEDYEPIESPKEKE
ncbi:MAG: hypothetical protein ACTSO9_17625 [Candidatus Helarchaeota archaeon]